MNTPKPTHPLDALIAAYLQADERGEKPDREALLLAHPELASELRAFFADHDRMNQIAERLADAVPPSLATTARPRLQPDPYAETLASGMPVPDSSFAGVGDSVRYFGDYELQKEIARGGMGVVFHARQVSLNRAVALKMILAGQLASSAEVQRFRAEAEAAAKLDHPHIVPIFEVGEHQGQHYFSMKLIDGGSLTQAAQAKRETLSFRDYQRWAATLMVKVARAVHHAHQRGILHRDLKPSNVLIDSKGEPHITDFGLAKRTDNSFGEPGSVSLPEKRAEALTHTGAILGTPSYMAPEQARGEKTLTTAVDVYSLGAILYELLTTQPPFKAATTLDTILHVLDRDAVPPRSYDSRIDIDLETIALKCLEKQAAKRYGSADALAEDLERFLRDEPIAARRIGRVARFRRWCRRNPALAALVFLVPLSLIAVSLLLWRSNRTLERLTAEQYVSQVTLAHRDFLDRDYANAREHLARCPEAFRHWEWSYLHRQTEPQRDFKFYRMGSLQVLAATPDGKQAVLAGMVSGGKGCMIRIDPATGEQTASYDAPANLQRTVDAVAIAGNGDSVAGAIGNDIAVWTTGPRPALTLKGHTNLVRSLAFTPDGEHLLSGGDDFSIRLWNRRAGHLSHAWKDWPGAGSCLGLSVRPDGKQFAAATRDALRIVDLASKEVLHTVKISESAEVRFADAVAYSPDGTRLAVGTKRGVILVDAESGTKVATWQLGADNADPNNEVTAACLAWSPDGKWLAAASGRYATQLGTSAVVWNAVTGARVAALSGHDGLVTGLAFSADSRTIITSSHDTLVKFWDLPPEPFPDRFGRLIMGGATLGIGALGLSADGSFLAIGYYAGPGKTEMPVRIWDTRSHQVVFSATMPMRTSEAEILSIALSADGALLAAGAGKRYQGAGTGSLCLWNARSNQVIATHDQGFTEGVGGVALSPDGSLLAAASNGYAIRLFRTQDGAALANLTEAGPAVIAPGATGAYLFKALAFAPDGRALLAASTFQLHVWDLPQQRLRMSIPVPRQISGGGTALALTPDGRRLAAAAFEGWCTWSLPSVKELSPKATGWFESVALSPDGKRLVTTGPELKLWSAETGAEVLKLRDRSYRWAAFSPDGRTLYAADSNDVFAWTIPK